MWQVGRVCHRGSGGMLVVGPLGVALVTEERVSAALDVVEGRAVPATLTSPAIAAGEALLLLDLSGPAPQVTLSGEVVARAWPYGVDSPLTWESPMETETVDPLQWVALDVDLASPPSDEASGMWLPLSGGVCSAGTVRIGIPGACRAGSPTSGAPATTTLSTESSTTAPVGPDTPVPSSSQSSTDPVDTAEHPGTAEHPIPPEPPDTTSTPEPTVTASAARAADIPETSDIPYPAGTGVPSTWTTILDERTTQPSSSSSSSSSGAHEDTLTTWDTTRLGASPSQERPTGGADPHAADAAEPDPLAFNPEAFERTMTPALLEELRRQAARTQGSTPHPTAGSDNPAPSTLPRGRGTVEGTQTTPAPTPPAFLVYAGAAPLELTRDVVIGRDPDTRALTGRPPAATLRVPSPAGEISRSHCVVLSTAPASWSVMDLGSANGTVVRTPHTDPRQLPAQVATVLQDGDLVELGEGIVVEFRVRHPR